MSDSLIAFECYENDGEQAAFKVVRADGSVVCLTCRELKAAEADGAVLENGIIFSDGYIHIFGDVSVSQAEKIIVINVREENGIRVSFDTIDADGLIAHFERSDKRERIIKLENPPEDLRWPPGLDETPEPFNEETVRLFEEERESWSE